MTYPTHDQGKETRSSTTIDYLSLYMAEAPMSFALSRAVECKVLARMPIEAPVLDLGCGDGLFARIFFQGEPVEVGIDISMAEARRARAAGSYREVVLASGAGLPFASGSFRTLLSNSVLEHVSDLPATLKECHRILEVQGRMIVTVPVVRLSEIFFYSNFLRFLGASGAAENYINWKHRIWRHFNMFDENGWASRFETAGFRVDDLHLFYSQSTGQVADFLFPFSPPSLLIKKLFGRMVLRPAFWSRILTFSLRSTYDRDGTDGQMTGTVCIVATKTSGDNA